LSSPAPAHVFNNAKKSKNANSKESPFETGKTKHGKRKTRVNEIPEKVPFSLPKKEERKGEYTMQIPRKARLRREKRKTENRKQE